MTTMSSGRLSRSRQGCWTCRGRRVRCDETRPTCQRCLKTDQECHYELRLTWLDDSLARGLCHGREGVWTKHGNKTSKPLRKKQSNQRLNYFPRIQDPHFLNTTTKDIELYLRHHGRSDEQVDDPDDDVEYGLESNLSVLPQDGPTTLEEGFQLLASLNHPQNSLSILPTRMKVTSHDSILLSYYENVICSSSTFVDDERNNPYRHVILPMALESSGLYHATLAISAITLRLGRPEYAVAALEHRQQALKCLINLVNLSNYDTKAVDEILGLVLLLCWFEISDGCRPSWVNHLTGFRSLMARHQQIVNKNSVHSQKLEQFFIQYFVFHLVLAKTTFQVEDASTDENQILNSPIFQSINIPANQQNSTSTGQHSESTSETYNFDTEQVSSSTSSLSLHMSLDDLDQIDTYMGFSNSLLLLINEITDLPDTIPNVGADERNRLLIKSHRLKLSLEGLRQYPPPLNNQYDEDELEPGHKRPAMIATAESYRYGALLLLHEVLSRSYAGFNIVNRVFDHDNKDEYTSMIFKLLDSHIEDMTRTAALPLWPLFIAGCCVNEAAERVTVMKIFDTIEQQNRFGNITPARKVLEMVWRQRDLTLDDRQPPLNPRASTTKRGVPVSRKTMMEQSSTRYEWEVALKMLGGWKISLT